MYDYATRQEQINIKTELQEIKDEIIDMKNNNVTQLDSILQVLSVIALAVCFAIVVSIVRRTIWRR